MQEPSQRILQNISDKKARLDGYRPLPPQMARDLNDKLRVEITYESNAVEGNTLTRSETALVVEKGITTGGKSLREHLEAVNHAEALDHLTALASERGRSISRHDLLSLHGLMVKRIDDENAGRFRTSNVKLSGIEVTPPGPQQVPRLMDEFMMWLNLPNNKHPAMFAADAHLKFVGISPFVDGNGRMGRLLMSLLIMRHGYPPALIRKEDLEEYLGSIETAQLTGKMTGYYEVMYRAIERSLDLYLAALEPKEVSARDTQQGEGAGLLKIGELAREAGENVHTIRYWTNERLLSATSRTTGGYQLYERAMVEQAKKIRQMQQQERLTIEEIRNGMGDDGR